jgi:cell division protein FtsI/penicillin-binding protein 2
VRPRGLPSAAPRSAARYAIAVYIEHRGPGGGVAAGLAAEVTRRMAQAL